MARETCYRCFWPVSLCWCGSIRPMETKTRFVFLMHPKEFKQEKAGTGRLTHLCLPNSEILMGIEFTDDPKVKRYLTDSSLYPVLLYPGPQAFNLSQQQTPPVGERQLVVFLLDATWPCARKMLKLNPWLQTLPRVMFSPETATSRYIIKQQPQEGCLSTLEATHELLQSLETAGLDTYSDPEQLLGLFDRMQRLQIEFASNPNREGYRKRPYSSPAERAGPSGKHVSRRIYIKPPA